MWILEYVDTEVSRYWGIWILSASHVASWREWHMKVPLCNAEPRHETATPAWKQHDSRDDVIGTVTIQEATRLATVAGSCLGVAE